ncbi:ABC transporter ATP-binding protein [Agrobacterium sp. OT33]|uniref:ABC transporter ATP-binding protein n=1 Tax=Agrobacterium sp. OT33 TaxID=2815338 RepID=UPI001A8DC38B|nr:ABC transporter ATP-binding protein [Agrobacterium sp. OT33]MBO0128497.1 ABC transporter ATP-binding protein [Agrobacterium sp. OT33]
MQQAIQSDFDASFSQATVGSRALLDVRDLTVSFPNGAGTTQIVRGLDYSIARGETLGIVGESGCGKTMTSLALLGLIAGNGKVGGTIGFDGQNLAAFSQKQWQRLRGRRIAMIFQEPMTAMNPVMSVGRQISEVLVKHENISSKEAASRAVDLLDQVGIPSPARRAEDYPHQLSGGMRQRAMIAMALACKPDLLIADEPTTALDVTIQAQILDLMLTLQDEARMSIQFISHNLAVVSEVAHAIMVMYAGKAVEHAPSQALFENPLHPYTQGLIATLPDPDRPVKRLYVIPGRVTSEAIPGCRFARRCPLADDHCRAVEPALLDVIPGHRVACHKANP